MLLKDDFALGIVKEVGDRDVVLLVNEEEIEIQLTEEQAQDLHQHLIKQDNLLIPINIKTHELYLDNEKWNEEDMDELIDASDE